MTLKGTREHQTTPSSKTTEGHPQSDVTQRRAGFLQATDQRSFQLKSMYQTKSLKWLNRVVFYL